MKMYLAPRDDTEMGAECSTDCTTSHASWRRARASPSITHLQKLHPFWCPNWPNERSRQTACALLRLCTQHSRTIYVQDDEVTRGAARCLVMCLSFSSDVIVCHRRSLLTTLHLRICRTRLRFFSHSPLIGDGINPMLTEFCSVLCQAIRWPSCIAKPPPCHGSPMITGGRGGGKPEP